MKSKLNKLGFGAWQIGGSSIVKGKNKGWSDIDTELAVSLVSQAYSLGIRFFDTSCSYGQGRSEEILGLALAGKDDAVICTKYGPKFNDGESHIDFSTDNLRKSLDQSLQRLGRDSIDYLLMHNPQVEDITPEIIATFGQLKQEGLIRKSGISVSFIEPYQEFIEAFDSFELLYNCITENNLEYLSKLSDKDVFLRSIFASGLLLKSREFFENKNELQDWRQGLPKDLFDRAEAATSNLLTLEERYHKILSQSLELDVDRIILGMSKRDHLKMLTLLPES